MCYLIIGESVGFYFFNSGNQGGREKKKKKIKIVKMWMKIGASVVIGSAIWEAWVRRLAGSKKAGAKAETNPFMNLQPVNHYRRRYIWPGALLVPLRLSMMITLLLIAAFIGLIVCKTGSTNKPLTGIRKILVNYGIRTCARLILFCLGFHYISVKGTENRKDDVAPIIVGNHRGPFEPIYLVAFHNLSMVSAAENRWPVLKYGMDALQFIFVHRRGPGRKGVVDLICDRAKTKGFPQVGLFPEGTTTNGTAIINFKAGAFIPGVPVQPIAFEFPNSDVDVDPSWVFGVRGPNMGLFNVVLRLMSSWHNPMTVTYLPVATPTKLEKKDAGAFAERVRKQIAKALSVPVTEHAQEDAILATAALKVDMPPRNAVVEWGKVKKLWDLSLNEAKDLLQKFSKADSNCDGEISVEDFTKVLGLPPSSPLLDGLFNMMNTRAGGSNTINFREFLSGMAKASGNMSRSDKCQLCFNAFDFDGTDTISMNEFRCMLKLGWREISPTEVSDLFNRISEGSSSISNSQFLSFVDSNEEFLVLFDILRREGEHAVQDSGSEDDEVSRKVHGRQLGARASFLRNREKIIMAKDKQDD